MMIDALVSARTAKPRSGRLFAAAALVAALAAAGCKADTVTAYGDGGDVNGVATHTIAASAGSDVVIRLQNIGPGEYATPPGVSSPEIHFVGMIPPDVVVPAGVTQRFRFHADAAGRVVITFHHTGGAAGLTVPDVQDTIVVR